MGYPRAMPSAQASLATVHPRARQSLEDPDQHIILNGMTWKDYEILLAVRGDQAGVRMYFVDGAIELMSPSRSHEEIKKTLARLLEAYCDELNIELNGCGSWTLRNVLKERGAEPDECYMVGATGKDVPDFAIEVSWSHGGLNKLAIYRGLGVPEVWMWDRQEGLRVYALREGDYTCQSRSQFLPGLDPLWLVGFLEQPTQSQAVRAMRGALRSKSAE